MNIVWGFTYHSRAMVMSRWSVNPVTTFFSWESLISSTQRVIDLRTSWINYHWTYTETIKLCPLDVYMYVCQFLMYERISNNFLHYKLLLFRNVMRLNEIRLITNRAADNLENTSTLKIKSHNINSLCVHHNSQPFKHIKTSVSKSVVRCYAC